MVAALNHNLMTNCLVLIYKILNNNQRPPIFPIISIIILCLFAALLMLQKSHKDYKEEIDGSENKQKK